MRVETIFSRAALDIVTQPYLVGDDLQDLAFKAGCDFVRSLDHSKIIGPVVVLEILRGGRYYAMDRAWKAEAPEATKNDMTVCSLRAKRFQREDKSWHVRMWDEENFDALCRARTIIIGDTVATGTTLNGVLSEIVRKWVSAHQLASGSDDVKESCNVYVWTIAGAGAAQARLEGADKDVTGLMNGTLHMTYANAVFNLDKNGTDMCFQYTNMHDDAKRIVQDLLGPFAAKMKCAIWDWGERFYASSGHLQEVSAHFGGIENTPKFISDGIAKYAKILAEQHAEDEDSDDGNSNSDAIVV